MLLPPVKLRRDSPEALMNLGVTLSDLGRFDAAVAFIRKAIQLKPDLADSADLGTTLAQGHLDDALLCYERALMVRPDFPEARRNRAYIWLMSGDFTTGWQEHEWRLKCPRMRHGLAPRSPRWCGEELAGRTILLCAEQGLGDILQFIRFAHLVKARGGRVLVACPDSLIRLAARCPGVDLAVDWTKPLPDSDVHAQLLSLPGDSGHELGQTPCRGPIRYD